MSNINIIANPNSKTSSLVDELNHISKQNNVYSQYDTKVPDFEDDELVERFTEANSYMLRKILVIIIICILTFIIYNFSIK